MQQGEDAILLLSNDICGDMQNIMYVSCFDYACCFAFWLNRDWKRSHVACQPAVTLASSV